MNLSDSMASLFFVEKSRNSYVLNNNSGQRKKEQSINQDHPKKSSIYLSVPTIQEMVLRLLTEKRMSKKELAAVLKITIKNIERILAQKNLSKLKPKINLPLIRLYCGTKWD